MHACGRGLLRSERSFQGIGLERSGVQGLQEIAGSGCGRIPAGPDSASPDVSDNSRRSIFDDGYYSFLWAVISCPLDVQRDL